MGQTKVIQFIKEFFLACVITWAMVHTMGCISISQQTALAVIQGK